MNLDKLTIEELDNFGRDIQTSISEEMDLILSNTKLLDSNSTGRKAGELSLLGDRSTRSLKLAAPIIKFNKMIGRYDSAERQIDTINDSILKNKDNLDTVLYALYNSKQSLESNISKLTKSTDRLEGYISDLKIRANPDSIRVQSAVNRMKVLTTLKVTTEQILGSTVLLIQENKEISRQLEDVIAQVTPMFKMMLVNTLAIKTQNRSLNLQKITKNILNDLMVSSAKEIQTAANQAIENRNTSIIDPEAIEEANKILQDTVKKVITSSYNETEINTEVIKRLQKASIEMSGLSNQIQQSIEDKGAIMIDGTRY